ncbi:MAG: peptidyl-tRNA hydrolase [Candidatus Dojkabacteria bacterium]|nr:MAG: peptidyl-tRNA hydrolase [Candidatus Dojkabacteria bacterium]
MVFDFNNIKLIIALGNIGAEYTHTRHNVGFLFVEKWVGNENFKLNPKLKCYIKQIFTREEYKYIALPNTMMNLSGDCVASLMNFYKFDLKQILIIHDDLDIKLGNFILNFGKGPKSHNGILDIENKLKSKAFWRLRIGIENRNDELRKNIPGKDYVLSRFDKDEINILDKVFNDIIETHLLL